MAGSGRIDIESHQKKLNQSVKISKMFQKMKKLIELYETDMLLAATNKRNLPEIFKAPPCMLCKICIRSGQI